MRKLTKVAYFSILVVLACAMIIACPPQTHYLSGTVVDAQSGQVLAGATVYFASHSTTTAADGTFSIELAKDVATETGSFAVHLAGYVAGLLSDCSCSTQTDTNVTVRMGPVVSGSSHAFSGRIYELQTDPANPTEIASGSQYVIMQCNSAGGHTPGPIFLSSRSYPATGYTGNTTAYGSDCLVSALVNPSGWTPFNVVRRQVDLSSPTTALNLVQDTASTTAVTLTGDAIGNTGTLLLDSTYGAVPAASVTFSSSTSVASNVTNPYSYQGIGVQVKMVQNSPITGYVHAYVSASTPTAIGTSITLPAINNALGPTGAADPATLAYASGTLSVSPVTAAGFYEFVLTDTASGNMVGFVLSKTNSVSLPSWLATELSTRSIRVAIIVGDASFAWELSTVLEFVRMGGYYYPGASIAIVDSMSGANWKDISF